MQDNLRLIGAAFPRTGTMSVKKALEMIGMGRCYHMHEVFLHPHHVPIWQAAGTDQFSGWEHLLAGYTATLDVPACLFWRELSIAFPDAKVLLLQRDPATWYDSMYATVYHTMMRATGEGSPALTMARRLFLDGCMHGRFEEREYAMIIYQRYCAEVVATIPHDRLLVYEVSQGWAPLCRFLGYEIPSIPFPEKNARKDFRGRSHVS